MQFFGGNSTRVEAVDSDGPGLNSEVSYDKDGEDRDLFSVDKDTGIVTVAPGNAGHCMYMHKCRSCFT